MSWDWLGDLWNGVMDLFGVGATSAQIAQDYQIQQKNYEMQLKNYELQKDSYQFQKDSYLQNFEYQKNLQQQLFNREDNSVQRRALDLEKAGLSKTLAAGGGAGVGSVVSTSPSSASFNGSAPQMSNVDLVGRAINLQQAFNLADKTRAETEFALKQGQRVDSQILNDEYQRNYVLTQIALNEGDLSMLPLRRSKLEKEIQLTDEQMKLVNEQVLASIQNRKVSDYNLRFVLPKEVMYKTEQIANLKKQGQVYDADVLLKDLQRDLLTQNINNALFESKIKELDYYYQNSTGFKPRSASSFLGDVAGAVNSSGYKDYFRFLGDVVDNFKDGYKKLIGKDKTPK